MPGLKFGRTGRGRNVDDDETRGVSWQRLEFAGVTAFALTMSCLFIGQAAEHFAAQVQASPTQMAAARPRFNAIDYATTGAVKNATVIIGPCEDRRP